MFKKLSLTSILSCCVLALGAQTFTVDGIAYNVTSTTSHEVEVGSNASITTDSVTIPSTVTNGGTSYTVTGVAARAFLYNKNITYVNLPSTVKTIGNFAFYVCENLSTINFPENLESIGRYAFGWSGITSATIPAKIKNLTEYAFINCDKMTKLTFEEGVQSIGQWAFAQCYSLDSIQLPRSLTSVEPYLFFLCSGLKSTGVIHKELKHIGANMFIACSSLTDVQLEEGLTTLGEDMFCSCSALTHINLPSTLDSIGAWALAQSGLISVVVPANVKYLGEACFNRDMALTSVTLPEGLEVIDDWCFSQCTALSNVKLPSTLKKIGDYAFNQNTNVTSITLPAGLDSLGFQSFAWAGITSMDFPVNVKEIPSECLLGSSVTSVNIPEGITKLGEGIVGSCKKLTSLTVPSTVTEIEGNLAYNSTVPSINCKSSAFVMEDNNQTMYTTGKTRLIGTLKKTGTFTIPSTVTSLAKRAFSYTNYSQLDVPEGVKSIDDYAFSVMSNLSKLTLPSTLTQVGKYFILSCSSLTSVSLPDGITDLPDHAVFSNSNLESVKLPANLETIGEAAFSYCPKIKSIDFPAKVKSIGKEAFASSTALTSVTSESTTPPALFQASYEKTCNVFPSSVYTSATLYVPKGTTSDYAAATGWKQFTTVQELEETGVDETLVTDDGWKIAGGNLNFSQSGMHYEIYTVAGAQVATGTSYAGTSVKLPQGFSVVKVGDKAVKAMGK